MFNEIFWERGGATKAQRHEEEWGYFKDGGIATKAQSHGEERGVTAKSRPYGRFMLTKLSHFISHILTGFYDKSLNVIPHNLSANIINYFLTLSIFYINWLDVQLISCFMIGLLYISSVLPDLSHT